MPWSVLVYRQDASETAFRLFIRRRAAERKIAELKKFRVITAFDEDDTLHLVQLRLRYVPWKQLANTFRFKLLMRSLLQKDYR